MFDPYHKWLGIPAKDRPPNYYRLLGLEMFETDLDVIEGAADRLMAFVRQYQSGEQAQDAARILNELATARMCLLKPARKAEYDAELKSGQSSVVESDRFASLALDDPSDQTPSDQVRQKSTRSNSAKAQSSRWPVVCGIAAVVVVLILVVSNSLPARREDGTKLVEPQIALDDAKPRLHPAESQSKSPVEREAVSPATSSPPSESSSPQPPSSTEGQKPSMNGETAEEPHRAPSSDQNAALPPSTELADQAWLIERKPDDKALLIMPAHDGEWQSAILGCRQARLPFDIVTEFPPIGFDYSQYSLIVIGSNIMDYWGGEERKNPTSFQSVENFVRRGGHLLVFNTFNGRNMEQLKRFGLNAGFYHTDAFEIVSGITEIVFDGAESLIPESRYLKQSGHFTVDKPHVVLLRRGSGSLPGEEAAATWRYEQGRVTYCSAEPFYGNPPGFWLVQGLTRWAGRGAPISRGDQAKIEQATLEQASNGDSQAESSKPSLTILEAKFGTDTRLVDATPRFVAASKGGVLILQVEDWLFDHDPAPGLAKSLRLKYRLNGLDEFQQIDQHRVIQLDGRPINPTAKMSQDFKLIEVHWGAGPYNPKAKDLWTNVTGRFKQYATAKHFKVSPEQIAKALKSANAPRQEFGQLLVIQYQFEGRDQFAVISNLTQQIYLGAPDAP